MPTPQEAAAILKRAMDSGWNPTQVSANRRNLRDELAHNLDLENEDRVMSLQRGRARRVFSGATPSDLEGLKRDIADDPYTGDDEQARIGNIRQVIDQADTTMRDDVGAASKTMATRNAFSDFMKKKAGYQADVSGEGTQALDAASRRKVAENDAASLGKVLIARDKEANKGLSAEGTKSAVAMHQAVDLGNKLHKVLTEQLQANPQASRESGYLGQAKDMAVAPLKRWMYAKGALQSPAGYDESTQLADWMKVLATRGLMGGVRNMEWIAQIQDHLAAGRLPPAASLQRLEQFLKQAPDLERDIYDVEKGHQRLDATPDKTYLDPSGNPIR